MHPKRQWINSVVDNMELEGVMLADGHDDAIIGLLRHPHSEQWAVAYSVSKIIASLVADGMTEDEAIEYFDYNIAGAYVGPGTPVYIQDDMPDAE